MVGESLLMLFVTLSCFSSTSPQNLQDYLPTEVNTLSSSNLDIHQSQLPENAHLVAELLAIINQDIHLVGHNTTITPEKVETRFRSKHELSKSMSGMKGQTMLSLQNSTVHVRRVAIDNSERESRIFFINSSTVLFEEGKLVSCGLESPFLVVSSEESLSRFGSRIVVSSSEIVWKEDAQPPLVDTLSTSAAVSVFGSGLRFDSKILSSGTGPLFSFGLHPSTEEIVPLRPDSTTTTHLSACSLVNMSSSCASNCESLPSLKFGSCVSQTLVGCSLSRSSNHQSGTGMLDINMGGSLHCQNSSFSHCTRTSNSAKTEQYKHYNSTHSPYTLPTGATSLSFILCTFDTMTYSEKEGAYGGAAIFLSGVSAPLSVSKCFFHKCTVTKSDNDGGAIRYISTTTGTGLTVSDSSFTECASTSEHQFSTAGAVISEIPGSSTISNCFFEKCWAKGRGGALYLINTPSTLSNCAFLECSTNTYGGGVLFRTVPSAKMTSVQFRACKANGTVSSRDVATITMSTTLLNSTSVQFCDSTSGSPNIYHCDTTSSDGSLIPQVGRSAAVVSSSVEIVGTTATVSMTMSEKIKGQMGVLLEGANVPRLIFLTFGTSTTPSTTATADFTLSSTTILPTLESGKKYTIRSWSFPYGKAGVDGVTGSTANPTTASITISGYHFREGSYQMKVKTANQNELTISLTSPTLSSLSGTFGMSATDSSKLRYAREYEVKCIVFNSTSLSKPSPLTFSIPYPSARLTNIAQVNSTDWLTLSFEGSGFVAESYIIALSGRDEDGQTQETTITLAPTSLTALPVVNMSLYPLDEASLRYGMEYTITSMISTDTFQNVVLDVNSFSTIPEPVRITTLTRSGYDELDKTAFFSVEGRVLVEGATYKINVLSSSSAAFCFNFTASSTTGGEGSAILFSADPSKVELDYDTAYTVSRVEDAEGVELILHSTFTFSTIEEPGRVMRNGDAAALEDRNRTTIALVGHNMQIGTFSLELVNVVDETEKPVITASFDSATTGQASASLHPTVELKYGGTYRLVKMTTTMANARPVHVEPSLSFIVGVEPSRLTEIGTVVAEDSDRRVKIGLTGIKMTNGPFSLTLNNTKTLTATFEADGESGSMSAILFTQDDSKVDLEYDTEYTVTGLTDKASQPTFFHSSLSFRTPVEPARLVKLNVAKYDDDKTRIFVELIGEKLGTTGNYSVELSLDGSVKHTIDMSLTSESKWIGSALLYPSSSCELEYGKTYDVSNFTHTLNSVTSSRFFESNTLEIDAEPARITTLTRSGYDELDKTAFFSVEGRVLVEGESYRINVLSSSSAAFCFNFTASSTTGGEGSAILFSADPSKVELDYDTEYTVSRVEDAEGVELILHSTFTFSTIEEPGRVMRNGDAAALEDRNRTTIALVGHNMQVGTFLLELVNVVDETEKPVISARFDSATTGQASASLHPTVELKYGGTYRLVKMTTTIANARPVHVEPSLSFIVTDEPSRLTEVGTVVPEDDSRQVKMALTGIKMTNGPFSLTLNNSKTLTATFEANGESGSMSAILFSQEESKVDLKYDTEYTVTGLTDKENKPTFFHSSLSFRTPLEPTRLVKLNVAKYDDDKTRIFVELVGSKLGTTGNYSVELSLDGSVKHTIDMSLTSESKWIGSALLYPSSSCELEYGKTYDVSNFTHTLNSVTSSHFFEANTLQIEPEPSRIVSFVSATLNKDRLMMIAKFGGRAFKSEMSPVLLKTGTNTFESIGNVRFVDSTHCEADFMVGDSEPGLVYEQSYTLATKGGESSIFVNSDVSVRVPAPPLLTHVSFAPLNKLGVSGLVLFEGTDLEADTEYQITLEPSFSFTIRISNSTSASSSPLLVGWSDSLPFSTTFKIVSITPVDSSDGDVLNKSLLSFNTSDRPTELFIHLDSKSTDSSLFCGTFEHPCATIESGWKIVNGLAFARPTLGIIDSTTLSSQLTVSEGMHVLLTHGSNSEPTLTIPSSATHSEGSGLIVVTNSSLEILNVDIVLNSPLSSFVLISASSSSLLLKDGLITQKHQNTLPDSNSDICSWSTGIIQTTDCELNVTFNAFTRISAGAINMKGGNLTLTSSSFSDNTPPDSSFTSSRRNIHCSEQGEIDLQILPTVGDGSKQYPSAWMSLEECVLSGKDAPIDAPLFIPTLSKTSHSKLEKKAGHFDVQIEGKTLIPCGLFLEVFEVSKDKREGKSTNFELTQSSSTSFTETAIAFNLSLSKLTSLDPNLEWRGRLVFGNDQVTSESIMIQQNSQERMSQSVKDNMKWWLPLVIVLASSAILIIFIIVLCCRRRNSKKEEGKKAKEEMDNTPEDLDIVKEEEYPNMASTIIDPTAHHSSFIAAKTDQSNPTNKIPPEPSISVIPGQICVLKMEADVYGREVIKEGYANAGDTLYNRLHGTGKDTPLDRKKMRHDLVASLKQIYRVRPTASVFSKLSPFWVFLDQFDKISVRISDVGETEHQGDIGQQGFSQNVKKVVDDGKRWEPPEQAECKAEVDTSKVAVFRLGLLLWEITTGQIPFGETDGVNAQRQVGIGVLPRMDEVRPAELVDLISDCLSLDPLNRPSLNDIETRLSSIDSPTLVKENEAVHHPQRIEQVDHVFPGKPVKGNEAEEVWNDHEDHHTFSLSGTID
ncbi:hypothetical protein BLNAU_944 [Blattamonas nauphoetae]|uniref:Protein kinase domain-containing protein n=1 Tax=Blattamonas nauphoetae TaxID=2049346 RepID=A0ABQ9YJE2_9EUKA|nr:hypothetical protein BLNAU_944 [Blattamonas nauphoetae]